MMICLIVSGYPSVLALTGRTLTKNLEYRMYDSFLLTNGWS